MKKRILLPTLGVILFHTLALAQVNSNCKQTGCCVILHGTNGADGCEISYHYKDCRGGSHTAPVKA